MKKLLLIAAFLFLFAASAYSVCCSPVGVGIGCGTCKDGKDKCGCCGNRPGFLAGCNIFCCNCYGCRKSPDPQACEKYCNTQEIICEEGCALAGDPPRCDDACEKDKDRCYYDCEHVVNDCKIELWKDDELPPWSF